MINESKSIPFQKQYQTLLTCLHHIMQHAVQPGGREQKLMAGKWKTINYPSASEGEVRRRRAADTAHICFLVATRQYFCLAAEEKVKSCWAQTLIFPASSWLVAECEAWWRDHGAERKTIGNNSPSVRRVHTVHTLPCSRYVDWDTKLGSKRPPLYNFLTIRIWSISRVPKLSSVFPRPPCRRPGQLCVACDPNYSRVTTTKPPTQSNTRPQYSYKFFRYPFSIFLFLPQIQGTYWLLFSPLCARPVAASSSQARMAVCAMVSVAAPSLRTRSSLQQLLAILFIFTLQSALCWAAFHQTCKSKIFINGQFILELPIYFNVLRRFIFGDKAAWVLYVVYAQLFIFLLFLT